MTLYLRHSLGSVVSINIQHSFSLSNSITWKTKDVVVRGWNDRTPGRQLRPNFLSGDLFIFAKVRAISFKKLQLLKKVISRPSSVLLIQYTKTICTNFTQPETLVSKSAITKPISGYVRIACSSLMITSLLQVVNRLAASCELHAGLMQVVSSTCSKSANIKLQQV